MKKLVIYFIFSLLFCSCGVGTYSLSAGKPDSGFICVTDDESYDIIVRIDDNSYNIKTIKTKKYKSGRDIKNTSLNSIVVSSGQHTIEIEREGEVIVSKKVIISINETKFIEL